MCYLHVCVSESSGSLVLGSHRTQLETHWSKDSGLFDQHVTASVVWWMGNSHNRWSLTMFLDRCEFELFILKCVPHFEMCLWSYNKTWVIIFSFAVSIAIQFSSSAASFSGKIVNHTEGQSRCAITKEDKGWVNFMWKSINCKECPESLSLINRSASERCAPTHTLQNMYSCNACLEAILHSQPVGLQNYKKWLHSLSKLETHVWSSLSIEVVRICDSYNKTVLGLWNSYSIQSVIVELD